MEFLYLHLNLARLISRIDTTPSYGVEEEVLWKPKINKSYSDRDYRDKENKVYELCDGRIDEAVFVNDEFVLQSNVIGITIGSYYTGVKVDKFFIYENCY